MLQRLRTAVRARLPGPSIVYAFARAATSRHGLPPGELVRLDGIETSERVTLLQHAARVGPIFKAVGWNQFYVCVVDLSLGRRLLREHGGDLAACTLELESLFPKGFLRQMEGDDHRRYRRALVRAIKPEHLAERRPRLEAIAAAGLAGYAANQQEGRRLPEAYVATLNAIASGMLIEIFFGAEVGSAAFERLWTVYRKLGPHGLVWNVGRQQKEAFAEIRDQLLAQRGSLDARSIAGEMQKEGALDETALGNLIYMVEMGRYDLYLFFRWLSKYAADHPEQLERIAVEAAAPPRDGGSFTAAFVQETLRMDQSERLTRKATRDIVFDGYLIPRFAKVRVCLWEAHKSAAAFPDPFRFDPERFLKDAPAGDQFSPFGLDHHHCPLSDVTVQVSTMFLRALARGYAVTPLDAGAPTPGPMFVWAPATRFSVELHERPQPG